MLTRNDAQKIIQENSSFFVTTETIDNYEFEIYNYGLAGLSDFENPLKNNSLNAWDMRSLCFVKINNEWKHFLSLPKFFALNQTRGYMINDLKKNKVVGVYEKFDGSLITTVVIDNKVYCRSKNQFSSTQAIKANELIEDDLELKNYIISMANENKICIFELIGMDKIVVQYDKIELRGLFLRDNETGKMIPWTFKNSPQNFISSYPTIESLENISGKNFEGVVALLDNGMLVKSKTFWYENMHDVTVEKTDNLNRLIDLVLNNVMDDAIAAIDNSERVEILREVEQCVISAYKFYINEVEILLNRLKNEDRKSLAMSYPNKALFGFAVKFSLENNSFNLDQAIRNFIRSQTNSRNKAEEWIKQWR